MSIRPLPYFQINDGLFEKQVAEELRKDFIPMIKRRLPDHHLAGFSHSHHLSFVKKYKKEYPWFVRADISCFYPSLPHREALVQLQVAYKSLVGATYMPQSFKKKYLKPLSAWFAKLPAHRGLPVGSCLSAIIKNKSYEFRKKYFQGDLPVF